MSRNWCFGKSSAALALVPCMAFTAALGGEWSAMNAERFWQTAGAGEKIEVGEFNADLLEAAIFHETNRVRGEHNRDSLSPSTEAAGAARAHSQWMVEAQVLSHAGAKNGGKRSNPLTRLQAVGLSPSTAAENVAFTFRLNYVSGRTVYIREHGGRRIVSYEPGGEPLQERTYTEFARAVVQQLMDSPTHRKSLLDPGVTHAGMGVVLDEADDSMDRIFVTQKFFSHGPSRGAR